MTTALALALAPSRAAASGVGTNAMIAASLAKGTHYLRVRGLDPDIYGPFRVKVAAV